TNANYFIANDRIARTTPRLLVYRSICFAGDLSVRESVTSKFLWQRLTESAFFSASHSRSARFLKGSRDQPPKTSRNAPSHEACLFIWISGGLVTFATHLQRKPIWMLRLHRERKRSSSAFDMIMCLSARLGLIRPRAISLLS